MILKRFWIDFFRSILIAFFFDIDEVISDFSTPLLDSFQQNVMPLYFFFIHDIEFSSLITFFLSFIFSVDAFFFQIEFVRIEFFSESFWSNRLFWRFFFKLFNRATLYFCFANFFFFLVLWRADFVSYFCFEIFCIFYFDFEILQIRVQI